MNTEDPLYRFRLALSYLERVERELGKWEEVKSTQQYNAGQFDSVRAAYRAHRQRAREAVDACRARAREDLPQLETSLKDRTREQRKLIDRVTQGRVDARKANDENRRLTALIAELNLRAAGARAIVEANTTADLGAFIDLPIEDYAKKIIAHEAPATPKVRHMPTADVVAIAFAALVMVGIASYIFIARGGSTKAEFRAAPLKSNPRLISVEIQNTGSRSLYLYVPWPEGQARALPGDAPRSASFGILVYAVEPGQGEPKLVPDSEGCWKYRGVPLVDPDPIVLRSGLTANIILDTACLREAGVDSETIRLALTRHGGAIVGDYRAVAPGSN